MTNSIPKAQCNRCRQETEHDVIHSKTAIKEMRDGGTRTMTEVLSCRGCHELSIKETDFEDADYEDGEERVIQVTYKPPRVWRHPPKWLSILDEYDPALKGLLDEVYSATHEGQARLLSMGVRSVLDRMMTLTLGGDIGSFEEKLSKMVEGGYLAEKRAENIAIVIDAGSASTHRGFKPPLELVEEMVILMENLVREHYITGPMLQTARMKIPSRPRRYSRKTGDRRHQ